MSLVDEGLVVGQKQRKERSDKCHDIKFPVDQVYHMKLRTLCKQASRITGEGYTQTRFNTELLRYALKEVHRVNWILSYYDTKLYMHTNLLESEYEQIGGPYGLAIAKCRSERKTVHCLMMNSVQWIEGGIAIEKVLQLP